MHVYVVTGDPLNSVEMAQTSTPHHHFYHRMWAIHHQISPLPDSEGEVLDSLIDRVVLERSSIIVRL
jgi:hypothetical protein